MHEASETLGTSLIGTINNVSGIVDKELLEVLEGLMLEHHVNSINVSWCRFDLLGDRFDSQVESKK